MKVLFIGGPFPDQYRDIEKLEPIIRIPILVKFELNYLYDSSGLSGDWFEYKPRQFGNQGTGKVRTAYFPVGLGPRVCEFRLCQYLMKEWINDQ